MIAVDNLLLDNFDQVAKIGDFGEVINYLYKNSLEANSKENKLKWPDNIKSWAKTILALGNYGGGIIVVGWPDKMTSPSDIVGIDSPFDQSGLSGLDSIVPTSLISLLYLHTFRGLHPVNGTEILIQVLRVNSEPLERPYISLAQFNKKDDDSIDNGHIYTRRTSRSVLIDNIELRSVLRIRDESMLGNSNRNDYVINSLRLIKSLYDSIDRSSILEEMITSPVFGGGLLFKEQERHQARKQYNDFVMEIIELEKNSLREKVSS